jgi:hypothetical protein
MKRTYELARPVVLAICLALVPACSSSDTPATPPTPPCNQNPWQCAAGQTCWATDQVPNFSCLASGANKVGDACLSTIGAATCGDGLLCLQTMAGTPGQCRAFCDLVAPDHGCPAGETCRTGALGGNLSVFFHICVPSVAPDAGAPDAPSAD